MTFREAADRESGLCYNIGVQVNLLFDCPKKGASMKQSSNKKSREATAFLYERLSRDDNLEGESYSIGNQKKLLTKVAKEKGYTNLVHFLDDGISGVTMNRPGFVEMMQQLEQGKASAVFVKDLSRLGRNYIEVGRLTEEFFPDHDIRLVAVSDNIDTAEGENELAPIRNLFNEWYARDISKKRRISNKIKGNSGEPMGLPPYGYIKDPNNPKHWVIDEEAAQVVRRIFDMTLEGFGTEQIATQFEKEGISTLSMGDEMLLNTFSALAQEESQSISMNQRLSIVKRMELGEYVDSNAPYGYRLVDKALAVYEPEAAVVRDIFDLYLRGFSISEIGRELKSRNIPTKAGKESWHPYRIAYMLKNERYIGDSFYQKTYRETTVPFNQHINRGQEDRFYAKGTHPGIIDKDVFNAVQQLIQKRKETFSRTTTQNIYPLTSRIQCSECGSFYRRRSVSGTVKWVCALHKDDSTACDSNYYSEERIYDGFITMVNKLRFSEDNILGQVVNRLEMTMAAIKRNNLAARDLSKSIAELNAKLLMLEQLRSKGYLAPEVYQAQANEIGAELAKLKNVRQEKFNSKAAIMLDEVKKLKMLIFELEEPLEAFDEKLFLEIVKSIQINKEDEMSVEFLGGLRFRERI